MARVSYMKSTRAKAQLTSYQTVPYYAGKLTLFAPGLTSALIKWLTGALGLDESIVNAVEKLRLPDGHLRFCKEVTESLVTEMHGNPVGYAQAVTDAPFLKDADINHSDFRPDDGVAVLPRYNELSVLRLMLGNGTGNPDDPHDKQLGKITNPTVHIALGQFRRVMNMLIQEFGKPAQVVLEAARDLNKSPKEKDEIEKLIKTNERRNDRFRDELETGSCTRPAILPVSCVPMLKRFSTRRTLTINAATMSGCCRAA